MNINIQQVSNLINRVIDFFYPPFRPFFNRQTFGYAACGGGNTMLDIVLYFISYNFILNKEIVYTPVIAISPHIAAFLISFIVTFPLGFFLSKYVVFSESNLRGRVQLIRYFSLVLACLLLNYIFIKFFVEYVGIFPTPAKIFTTFFVVAFSYLSQKHFTFRVNKVASQAEPDWFNFYRQVATDITADH